MLKKTTWRYGKALWDREQRMMVIGEYRDNPPKGHTGTSDLYQFHRETIRRALAENADEIIKPEKTT